jgi:hypothetical protein
MGSAIFVNLATTSLVAVAFQSDVVYSDPNSSVAREIFFFIKARATKDSQLLVKEYLPH